MSTYTTQLRGTENTETFRQFFLNEEGLPISPMHDIPLRDKVGNFNFVVEIPRWTNSKMESNMKEDLNPLKQDTKKGELRYVANVFPHKGYIWNYGFLPQTWEDPSVIDESTQQGGDGDPIDVCEIGQKIHSRGSVIQVKILGILGLIDEGETDWKILTIDINDPLADSLQDIQDIEKVMPGFLAATVEWFKIYKVPDGKPINKFAFNGEVKNKEFALKIIDEVNHQWRALLSKPADAVDLPVNRKSTVCELSPFIISKDEAEAIIAASPPHNEMTKEIPDSIHKWHFVKL